MEKNAWRYYRHRLEINWRRDYAVHKRVRFARVELCLIEISIWRYLSNFVISIINFIAKLYYYYVLKRNRFIANHIISFHWNFNSLRSILRLSIFFLNKSKEEMWQKLLYLIFGENYYSHILFHLKSFFHWRNFKSGISRISVQRSIKLIIFIERKCFIATL